MIQHLSEALEKKRSHLFWLSTAGILVSASNQMSKDFTASPLGFNVEMILLIGILLFAIPWQLMNYLWERDRQKLQHLSVMKSISAESLSTTIQELSSEIKSATRNVTNATKTLPTTEALQNLQNKITDLHHLVSVNFGSIQAVYEQQTPEQNSVPLIKSVNSAHKVLSDAAKDAGDLVRTTALEAEASEPERVKALGDLSQYLGKIDEKITDFNKFNKRLSRHQQAEWAIIHSLPIIYPLIAIVSLVARLFIDASLYEDLSLFGIYAPEDAYSITNSS